MSDLAEKYPLIEKMRNGHETIWMNPNIDNRLSDEVTASDVNAASERLLRFAPFLANAFPDTDGGIIESPLREIGGMKERLLKEAGFDLAGRLFLKCDSHLPVSGSIKARGGIYEVLCFAEQVALDSGMLHPADDYSVLSGEKFKDLFSGYSLAVGSTGNLGLSIGIMGRALGFRVTVHMSADARQWKKDLLRELGAEVVEYAGDYEKAVAEGRRLAATDSSCHFVDDENSKTLFLGYAAAGMRLARQLAESGVAVDEAHPLFVYLPCGVGGGPGGVTYGIKQVFGKDAHCFFAEPVQAPCMMLGVMTGLHDKISALDIGLTGKTVADGLAVTRPSRLVGRLCGNLLDGLFTVSDERMEQYVVHLYSKEGIFIEPSATPGFYGYSHIQRDNAYMSQFGAEQMKNSTHIVWATGGSMVPLAEKERYLRLK